MRARDWLRLSLAVLTAGAALWSAWIFQSQLTAMQDQLAVMKADQRPWVGLDRFEPSSAPNGQGFNFAAIVKNSGKTAATNVHGSFKAGFFGNDVLGAVPNDCGSKCSVGLLLPDSTMQWPLAVTTSDVQKTIANTDGAFYVLGRIDYEDLESKYWTTICWYYDRDLLAFSAWSGCNEAGSEKKLASASDRENRKMTPPVQISTADQFAAVLGAPLPFFLAAIAVAVVIWRVIQWAYRWRCN
jgi:hypothetical protein